MSGSIPFSQLYSLLEQNSDFWNKRDFWCKATTAQELQAYDIVKDIAQDVVDPERISIRDAQSYCAILLDNNNRRLLCRLYFDGSQKYIGLFDGSRHSGGTLVEKRFSIESPNDLYTHADQIRETARRYLES